MKGLIKLIGVPVVALMAFSTKADTPFQDNLFYQKYSVQSRRESDLNGLLCCCRCICKCGHSHIYQHT